MLGRKDRFKMKKKHSEAADEVWMSTCGLLALQCKNGGRYPMAIPTVVRKIQTRVATCTMG